jgi:hypothetical protein
MTRGVLALSLLLPGVHAQFVQQGGKLVAGDFSTFPTQGAAVALSSDGTTALSGGPADNNGIGGAWVFVRVNGVWLEQATLLGGSAVGLAEQGTAVALSSDGNTAIVGGPGDTNNVGAAWIFTRSNGVWNQQSKLIAIGAIGASRQGFAVALSADGNTALVGGPLDNSSLGAAWVFTRINGFWVQQGGKLFGSGGTPATDGLQQGISVALSADGNTAIIGGNYDSTYAGAAWLFTRAATFWTQQTKLTGSGATGQAFQGDSVALSGDGNTALIGGSGDNNGLGATWVFTRATGTWMQQGNKLVGTGAIGAAQQGYFSALSYEGSTAITGAPGDNGGIGAAWVFQRAGASWNQLGSKLAAIDAIGTANHGQSVAISADAATAMVGGPLDNNKLGAAWIYGQPVATGPSSPTAVQPSSGSGFTASMIFTFNDPRGWQDLDVVNVLSGRFLDGRNACYLAYSRSAGVLYLVADNGGTLLPGGSNSQCAILSSSASGSGTTLTLTVNLSFTAAFGGNKVVYMAARDLQGNNSGWQALGVWQVPFTPAGSLSVTSLTPTRSSGSSQTFVATVTGPNVGVVNLLVNDFIDGRQACYLAYVASTNSLLLVDDAGDAGGPFAGSQNSQCAVGAWTAIRNGNTLTLTVPLTFRSAFDGNRIAWAAARDSAGGNNTDWQALSTTTVQ